MGFCGITHNVGVTLVSAAFSNYLSNAENYRVACLEMNGTQSFSRLTGHSKTKAQKDKSFPFYCIDFYPSCNLYDYLHIKCQGYDLILIDFGVLSKGTVSTFLECDLCLVLGYISLWNRPFYADWLQTHLPILKQRKKEIIFLGNLATDANVKEFKKLYGFSLIPVPYLKDPFQLTSGQFPFMESILGKIDIPQ